MSGSTWLAIRLARRENRRHPWRTALVVALVAIPVAGMVIATTFVRTEDRSTLEEWDDTYGLADVVVLHDGGLATTATSQSEGPARIDGVVASTTQRTSFGAFRTETVTARARIEGIDPTSPVWGGRFPILDGRAVEASGEVALSPRLARRFGVAPGDELTLSRPAGIMQVVGIVEDSTCLGCDIVFADASASILDLATWNNGLTTLYDLGDATAADLDPYVFENNTVVRPLAEFDWFAARGERTKVVWTVVIGALVIAVAGIVMAAAFAAGARGQLVTLGLLSSSGAPPRLLRRMLVLQGTVTGIIGTIVGLVVGWLGLTLGRGTMETVLTRRIGDYSVGVVDLIVIAFIGVAGATGSALIPARSVATTPTLSALAGRRPAPRVAVRTTAAGLVAMAVGVLLFVVAGAGVDSTNVGQVFTAVGVVAGLCVLFGATALTPALVERLEPLTGRLRGAGRLATRGLVRNRVRSGAIIAAVAAAGALAVGGTALAESATDRIDGPPALRLDPDVVQLQAGRYGPNDFEPDPVPADIVERVTGLLSDPLALDVGLRAVDAMQIRGHDYGFQAGQFLVLDPDEAPHLGLSDVAVRALRDQGLVVLAFSERPTQGVRATFGDGRTMDGMVTFSPFGPTIAEGVILSPDAAARVRGARRQAPPIYLADRDGLDDIERFDLREATFTSIARPSNGGAHAVPEDVSVDLVHGFRPAPDPGRMVGVILAAVSVLFSLAVVAIGLTLAAADDRGEREQLVAVGAAPRDIARSAALQASIMAGLGFALAIPVGYLPVVAVLATIEGTTVRFPFLTVAVLLTIVPLVAHLGTLAVSGITQRIRPVRVSTAAFE